MRNRSVFSLLFFLTLCVLMDSAKLSAEMEQVVVTGTRTAVLLTESPVKVDVLDSQAIQSTHAHNASEILQQLNGIQLQKITGKEGLGAMIQGVAADKPRKSI